MLNKLKQQIDAMLTSGDMPQRRPALNPHNESNVPGL
jgi:hypothetical protein